MIATVSLSSDGSVTMDLLLSRTPVLRNVEMDSTSSLPLESLVRSVMMVMFTISTVVTNFVLWRMAGSAQVAPPSLEIGVLSKLLIYGL